MTYAHPEYFEDALRMREIFCDAASAAVAEHLDERALEESSMGTFLSALQESRKASGEDLELSFDVTDLRMGPLVFEGAAPSRNETKRLITGRYEKGWTAPQGHPRDAVLATNVPTREDALRVGIR